MNFLKSALGLASCVLMLLQTTVCQFPAGNLPNLFREFPSVQSTRDQRENRGPVVFPPAPIPPDTSGVRVGASGFGFVPPSGPRDSGLRSFRGPQAEDSPFW